VRPFPRDLCACHLPLRHALCGSRGAVATAAARVPLQGQLYRREFRGASTSIAADYGTELTSRALAEADRQYQRKGHAEAIYGPAGMIRAIYRQVYSAKSLFAGNRQLTPNLAKGKVPLRQSGALPPPASSGPWLRDFRLESRCTSSHNGTTGSRFARRGLRFGSGKSRGAEPHTNGSRR
jgi:hypothetical protein